MTYAPNILWIRRLIWAYFWLLLLEGVLRKWVLPGLSAPLLIVRAPVVIAIYAVAIHARVFPFTRWVVCCTVLAFLCLFAGLYVLQNAPVVALFGFQADFLHLPLIFLIPRVFGLQDVQKVGFWAMVMALPTALLMVLQFEAPSTAWINAGAGDATQLSAANGHIRPAGLFTFITGPAAFFPFVLAFLLNVNFVKTNYPRWLLVASPLALIVGAGVSSSRGLAVGVGIVILCAIFVGTFLRPILVSQRTIMRSLQGLVLLVIAVAIATHLPVFSAGLETFEARVQASSGAEGGAEGFTSRAFIDYASLPDVIAEAPALGHGLGLGTNAGSSLVNGGQVVFMLAEGEFARVILESGPTLGLAYLLLRLSLAAWLAWVTIGQARQGNALPFLLFASCASLLSNGQFGQPTELGFAVLGSGLCIAAMRWLPAAQTMTAGTPAANAPLLGVTA